MWFKFIATMLSGAGAVLPYLASSRQQLLSATFRLPLPWSPWLAWLLFTLCQLSAIYVLTATLNVLAASLTVLVQVMCYWIVLTLTAAHHQGRPAQVTGLVLGLGATIALLGGSHGG